jgi:hypothetical protein
MMYRDIVEKLEFGCPFVKGSVGIHDSTAAEVVMLDAAKVITALRAQVATLTAEKEAAFAAGMRKAAIIANSHNELVWTCPFGKVSKHIADDILAAIPAKEKEAIDGLGFLRCSAIPAKGGEDKAAYCRECPHSYTKSTGFTKCGLAQGSGDGVVNCPSAKGGEVEK